MFLFLMIGIAGAAIADTPPVIHHDVRIEFDIERHVVEILDSVTIPAGVDTLHLNRGVFLSRHQAPGISIDADFFDAEAGSPSDTTQAYAVAAPGSDRTGRPVVENVFHYQACWHESTDDVVFSRENVGREIQGTVGPEGVYLAADGWLPYADGVQATHRVTVHTPIGWEPVTQGKRVRHEVVGDELITVWDAPHPSDGLILVANTYQVTERQFGDVTAYTYFLDDEPALVETYMERTGAYLDMYGEMIGPYPYAKFATVENWFATGYGMPSWTLLGGQVLRLPFIPTTSFGHEIAHNWWGNSAFVDDAEGNWCEGLTVYCADYHYKELESDDAAREYRRNLLKDYVAYVREDKDLPLSEFKARHSGATRAIGYGKSMMVFHMVDRMIGRAAFLAALRDVWSSHLFRPVAWSDFMEAFGRHGGRDFTDFAAQWLGRVGAPVIRLDDAVRVGDAVTVHLSQEDPTWCTEVPVVIDMPAGPAERVVTLEGPEVSMDIEAPGATAVRVDPDYQVFRRLHPEEIEPTLNLVLGDPEPRFVAPSGLLAAAGRTFAEDWIEGDDPVMVTADAPADGHARILIDPSPAVLAELLPAGTQVSGGLLFLAGRRHDLDESDAVLAVASPEETGVTWLVVLCRSVPRLARLAGRLGHYGKYSHLVFPARGRALRGNWPVAASPLAMDLD